jgi:hypothetical protein
MENEIQINGKTYVLKESIKNQGQKVKLSKGMEYCIIRSYSAGVFAGFVDRKKVENRQVTVYNARRLWYWDGAASLSQLSQEGVSKPTSCKFPMEVPEITLTDIAEIIPATQKAKESIDGVKVWSA